MRETITLSNGNEVEAGCWLSGTQGWTNSYRVIDIADFHGFGMDVEDRAVVDWYRSTGDSDTDASDATLDKLEAVTGQGGISDKATEYLEELLPAGWTLRWDDGLTLLPDYMDCAADGNGCDIETDAEGNETVKRCYDHTPEGTE